MGSRLRAHIQARLQDVHTEAGRVQRTAVWPCPRPAWPFCFRQENAVQATLAPSASPAQGKLRMSASETGSAWTEPTAQARVSVDGASAGWPARRALRASTASTATKVRTPAGSPHRPGVQAERGSKYLLPNQPVSRAGWNPATSM